MAGRPGRGIKWSEFERYVGSTITHNRDYDNRDCAYRAEHEQHYWQSHATRRLRAHGHAGSGHEHGEAERLALVS